MSPLIVHSNFPAEMPLTIAAAAHGGMQSTVTRLVLHDEEYLVGPDSAEQIAAYFASPGPGTSAHYVVDANSVQHCVLENVVAFHAPPNLGSIGIEHDGYSHFTAADWATSGSAATLARSAKLAAGICARWGLPVTFLTADHLRADPSARGITFHSQVSAAFGQSTHTDPGGAFPIDAYLANVRIEMAAFDPTLPNPAPPEGDEVSVDQAVILTTAQGANHRPAALLDVKAGKATYLSSDLWSAMYHQSDLVRPAVSPPLYLIREISVKDHDAYTGKGA